MTHRSSAFLAGASAASAAVPVPAGAAIGDIAVVGLYMESAAAVTPPAGFTLKVSLATSATLRGRLDVFWKRLTAADSGTYSFTWTGATWRGAVSGLWSGRLASGDPFDGTGTAESTSGVTTLNVAASPAAANGDAFGIWTNFSTSAAWTPPASYTEQQDHGEMTLDTRGAVAAGSTGNVTATSNTTDFEKAFLGVLAAATGGGNSTAASPALETDTAQAVGRIRATTAGVVLETDTAQPVGSLRATATAPATETDTAQPAGRVRATAIAPATETDAAQAAGRVRATAVSPALETDTAQPISTGGHSVPAAPALEVDTAQPVGRIRTTAVGPALEVDAAQLVARSRATVAAAAVEVDTAQPVTSTRATPVGPALETDTAQPIAVPTRDLLLVAVVELGRFLVTVESDRLAAAVQNQWHPEIESGPQWRGAVEAGRLLAEVER